MPTTDELIALPLQNSDYFEIYRVRAGKVIEKKIVTFAQLKTYFGGSFTQLQTDWLQSDTTAADFIKNKPSGLPAIGGMYVERSFLNGSGNNSILYIESVNKVYVANSASGNITIFNGTTGELLSTLSGASLTGVVHLHHVTGIATPEIWAFTTGNTSRLERINITPIGTPESLVGSISGFTGLVSAGNRNDVVTISPTKVYVTQQNNNNNSVAVVNPSTGTVSLISTATGGSIDNCGLALNTNPLSPMNGMVVQGRHTGLGIINSATDTMSPVALNPSSLFNISRYLKYVPSKDIYIVPVNGFHRIVILKPVSSTSFTVVGRIDNILTPIDIFVDEDKGVFYVSHALASGTTLSALSSFDLNNYTSLQTLTVGLVPSGFSKISVNPTNKNIYYCSGAAAFGNFVKIKY